MTESTITKEQLIEFGMIETKDPIYPMKKVISVPTEEGDDELGELIIAVTQMRNLTELCLSLPEGSIIYLSVSNIEDLKTFERCIGSWEPNY